MTTCFCRLLCAAILPLLLARSSFAAEPATKDAFTWSNPIRFDAGPNTAEVRDPCIIREGDTYYLVYTVFPFRNREEKHLTDPDQGSSPGIRLHTSRDLQTWTFDRWLVKSSELPENCPYKHRFWAPEIHKMGGKFYLIFTADNWLKNEYNPAGRWGTAGYAFVGVADKITGPYEHITYIPGGACDTSLFEDTDGKTYAIIPRGNVDIQQIDLTQLANDKVRLLDKPKMVVSCDNADINLAARAEYLEGPWLIKQGGGYILFCAGPYSEKKFPDQKGYWVVCAYADNIAGPWKKDPRGQVFLGGHIAVFTGPDGRNWFSYRGEKFPQHRGLLCIDPFDIGPDGTVQHTAPTLGRQSVK